MRSKELFFTDTGMHRFNSLKKQFMEKCNAQDISLDFYLCKLSRS